jgi:Rrf2 family iron-sulfur cluster assembly transcriptional regulator
MIAALPPQQNIPFLPCERLTVDQQREGNLFQTRFHYFVATISIVPRFYFMPILSRKGLLAIAAVVDVALQRDGRPVSAKTLTARNGLPPRYLEAILQSLAREGILKSLRGPRGGYYLAREPHGVTVNDIIRAAGMADAAEDELTSELVATVVLPALSAAEKECGQALSRISLNDMVRAALNGH